MPRSVSGDIRLGTTQARILRKAPDIKSGEICSFLQRVKKCYKGAENQTKEVKK